jgi:hypothetical protein
MSCVHNNKKYEFKLSNALHIRMFCFSQKSVLWRVVHPLKLYKHIKLHGPTLTDASFIPTSEMWTSEILGGIKVIFNGMIFLLNFMNIY